MWMFGYGSLMWDGWETEYGSTRSERASLSAFKRDFNKASTKNWGSQESPGPTLGLSPDAKAQCEGMAFELPDTARADVLKALKKREGDTFALQEKDVRLESGDVIKAVVPINDVSAAAYIGDRSISERAEMAKKARGSSGTCVDYVKGTREKLQALGIEDAIVEDFWKVISEGRSEPQNDEM